MKTSPMLAGVVTAFLLALAGGASAAEVEVKLLNKGSEGGTMAFEPAYVRIAPGDTFKFLSADSGFESESIKEILPHVAIPLAGEPGKDIAVRFEREGVYGMKCLPHHGICMVVMVGTPVNGDHAKSVPPASRAKKLSSARIDGVHQITLR